MPIIHSVPKLYTGNNLKTNCFVKPILNWNRCHLIEESIIEKLAYWNRRITPCKVNIRIYRALSLAKYVVGTRYVSVRIYQSFTNFGRRIQTQIIRDSIQYISFKTVQISILLQSSKHEIPHRFIIYHKPPAHQCWLWYDLCELDLSCFFYIISIINGKLVKKT